MRTTMATGAAAAKVDGQGRRPSDGMSGLGRLRGSGWFFVSLRRPD